MILILQDEMLRGLNAIYNGIVKEPFVLNKLPRYFMVLRTIKHKASLCRLQGIESTVVYVSNLNHWHVFAIWTCSIY